MPVSDLLSTVWWFPGMLFKRFLRGLIIPVLIMVPPSVESNCFCGSTVAGNHAKVVNSSEIKKTRLKRLSVQYTGGWNIWGGWFLAGNQGNHQNFVPSLISKNIWQTFIEMKQKDFFLKKKVQSGPLKKTYFLKWPMINEKSIALAHGVVVVTTESQYIGFWIGGPLK